MPEWEGNWAGSGYKITFAERAWRDLWTLPRETFLGILEKIHGLAELTEEAPPDRLATISRIGGPWRSFMSVDNRWVMYEVDSSASTIQVLGITSSPGAAHLMNT